jgi:hypothetical protein
VAAAGSGASVLDAQFRDRLVVLGTNVKDNPDDKELYICFTSPAMLYWATKEHTRRGIFVSPGTASIIQQCE